MRIIGGARIPGKLIFYKINWGEVPIRGTIKAGTFGSHLGG